MQKNTLNTAQKKAVDYTDGPLLIIAGAGTGKTTVITEKITHLVRSGQAKPEEILALTFTDKAAHEMEVRVDTLLDIGYVNLRISTFHAFCQELLQQFGLDIGLPNQFKLYTQTDAWLLLREHIYDLGLEYYRPLGNPMRHIQELLSHFSKCKDELIDPDHYCAYAEKMPADDDVQADEKKRLTEVAEAYRAYNRLLLDNGALDFGDLVCYAVQLLEQRPAITARLRQRYKYILVDEFQDVNWAQYRLVQLLAQHAQLTVVGDDDQSIYAFRGASVSNILRFKEDFPTAEEVVLNENYRSNQEILDLAYTSIQHNNPDRLEAKLHIDKRLISRTTNVKHAVRHIHLPTLTEEAQAVVKEIASLKKKHSDATWDDFAILVRANTHTEPFIQALEAAGIPYEYIASAGLYRQPIVMDCLNFFRVVNSVWQSQPLFHLFRLPGLAFPENDIQKITAFAKKKSISYYEALKRMKELYASDEGQRAADRLLQWIHAAIERARTEKPTTVLYQFLEESEYLNYLTKEEEAGNRAVIRQIFQLRQWFDLLETYERSMGDANIHSFLEYYQYLREAGDQGKLYQPNDTPDSVNILTVHSAKGLEFRFVFVVNLVEERFPTRRRSDPIALPEALIHEQLPEGDEHEQEERRLFYVALTRAKERLYLLSSSDYGGARAKKISRFLAELGFVAGGNMTEAALVPPLPPRSVPGGAPTGEEVVYEIPTSFSFSQIKAYETCPYQYKLAHVLKIPSQGRASFSFGQSMHLTLQRFYEQMQSRNAASQANLFESPMVRQKPNGGVVVPTLDELFALYDAAWIPDWYESKHQREAYYKKGKEILRIFYTSHEGNWRIPVGLESWFKIKIGDATLRGRIDRIDRHEDGSLEIVDYKTGNTKESLAAEDKEQLLLYQIAVESLPEYRHLGVPSKLTFYYLNDNVEMSFLGKEKELGKLKQKLEATIARIRSGNFEATPSAFVCKYCDFRDICPNSAA